MSDRDVPNAGNTAPGSDRADRSPDEAPTEFIFLLAADGTFASLRPGFTTITGWSRQWLGKSFAAIVHPDDVPRAMEVYRALLGEQRSLTLELRVLSKSGVYVPAELTLRPRTQRGKVVGVWGVARDISKRKQVEEALRASKQRYRELFENANDIVFTIDFQGNVTSANRAAERISGYRRDEMPTMNFGQFVAPEYLGRARQMLERKIAGGGPTIYELEITAKDGRRVPLEVSTWLIYQEGKPVGVHGIARDITERKRVQEALRRLNEAREEAAKRIARSLHDEAQALLTSVYIALAEAARDLPPPGGERLSTISALLDRIAEQLRHLSHELHPTILDDLGLRRALEFLADGISERTGLRIAVEAPPQGRLPPSIKTALYRIVQEALSNVVGHAQASTVTVEIRLDGDRVRCSIRDDGIGFDAAGLARVGGLGLIGIQERVDARSGMLQINSAPGRGTEVLVTLPLRT